MDWEVLIRVDIFRTYVCSSRMKRNLRNMLMNCNPYSEYHDILVINYRRRCRSISLAESQNISLSLSFSNFLDERTWLIIQFKIFIMYLQLEDGSNSSQSSLKMIEKRFRNFKYGLTTWKYFFNFYIDVVLISSL